VASRLGAAQAPSVSTGQVARAIGVVTEIRPGSLTLRTDAGPEVQVRLPEGVTVLRVPPGAKDLKTAAKITASEISPSDRVLVRGHFSADQKSLEATSVVVMTRSALASAHEAEVREWQQHGIGGVVKAVDPQTKQITIAVPNAPPTPANPTHPVIVTLAPNAVLLRYAPDSVKFSDARPSTFAALKVGDQVRALGTKSEDGTSFTAEKLVSGTFRNIGATVISVDAPEGTVTVKDLSSGTPLVVRTTADSKLHQLPPFVAMMIARFNSGGQAGGAEGETARAASPGGPGEPNAPRGPGGPGGMQRGGPRDFQQMLDHMPALTLSELKPGEPLIVVSTEGAKPSEVTAIAILTGVEPILAARPKGSSEMNLGPWNMSMGGGEGAE
jgi:hypothetical protein